MFYQETHLEKINLSMFIMTYLWPVADNSQRFDRIVNLFLTSVSWPQILGFPSTAGSYNGHYSVLITDCFLDKKQWSWIDHCPSLIFKAGDERTGKERLKSLKSSLISHERLQPSKKIDKPWIWMLAALCGYDQDIIKSRHGALSLSY